MWWRLVALWVGMAIAVYFLFFYRIETHVVKLDMPTGSNIDPHQVEIALQWFTVTVTAVLLLAILGLFVWLNIRVIRRYRKPI